jgi:hypothetical protein
MSEHDQADPLEKTWEDIDTVYAMLMLNDTWARSVLADRSSEFYKDASPDLILGVRASGVNAVVANAYRRNVGPVLAARTIGYNGVPDLARQLEGIYADLSRKRRHIGDTPRRRLGSLWGAFTPAPRPLRCEKPRGSRVFLLPEEGLEPPTRGL